MQTGLKGLRPPPPSPRERRWFPSHENPSTLQYVTGLSRGLRGRFRALSRAGRAKKPDRSQRLGAPDHPRRAALSQSSFDNVTAPAWRLAPRAVVSGL